MGGSWSEEKERKEKSFGGKDQQNAGESNVVYDAPTDG